MIKAIWLQTGAALALSVALSAGSSQALAQQSKPATGQEAAPATGWPSLVHPEDYKLPAKRLQPGVGFAQITSSLPTPRRPDGKPDLTGNWRDLRSPGGIGGLRRVGTLESDQLVVQKGPGGWNKPIYKPEYWEKVRSLDFSKIDVDPGYNCTPPGVPRQNIPNKIVQLDKEVTLFNGSTFRLVPFDGRARDPADSDEVTNNGIPLGHWEGDVLVIESIGFNDMSWLQWEGYFHTDQMKVTERIWRQGDLLFYKATVDDPAVLMEPWTLDTMVRQLNPNVVPFVEPSKCEDIGYPAINPYSRG